METPSSNGLTLREYPWILWAIGGVGLAISVGLWIDGQPWWLALALFAGGLLAIALAPITTLTASQATGRLEISYRSLLTRSQKGWNFQQIQAVDVDSSHSSDGATYQIVFVLAGGERVALHSYYSSGYGAKQRKAEKLAQAIGCQGPGAGEAATLQAVTSVFVPSFQPVREEITAGVTWRLESSAGGPSNLVVTRWFSDAYCFPAGFVLLAQIPPNDIRLGGWLQPISRGLWKISMRIFGFDDQDTPGFQWAQALKLDGRLEEAFQALSSAPADAQQALGPWAVQPLEEWARKHPMVMQRAASTLPDQLAVLVCPRGVIAAVLGALSPEQQEDLIQTGLALVKQLGH